MITAVIIRNVSPNLVRFKSHWLLAHDSRHFTHGTVFFSNTFIMVKIFTLVLVYVVFQRYAVQQATLANTLQLTLDLYVPFQQHTINAIQLLITYNTPIFILNGQEHVFFLPQSSLARMEHVYCLFVSLLWSII